MLTARVAGPGYKRVGVSAEGEDRRWFLWTSVGLRYTRLGLLGFGHTLGNKRLVHTGLRVYGVICYG